ncbi:ABC transporter permease [Streptomyces sclerotialus]|uniref:ABC transporter permease n=1 Tax=Streptomyces sclerotialus TaxID=1957 RepID=UPI0004C5678E
MMTTAPTRAADAPTAGNAATSSTRRGLVARLGALGRAELTLLVRSRAALFTALLLPAVMAVSMRGMVKSLDLGGTGLSFATVLLPGSLGMALFFAVYTNLVGVYVTRRESLVLKRLRTGEVRDWEIFAGGALPALLLALVQCVLLSVGLTAVLDAPAPAAPHLVVLGLLAGAAMLVVGAALTASFTRTAESAQLTFLPFMLVSMAGSGLFLPREVLPGVAADISAWLPFSPVMDLLRGGWTGGLDVADQARPVLTALAWTGVTALAVRQWFRWGPRH